MGVTYYTYRYYDPVTGRWPSRDPFLERESINLYACLENNSISTVDVLGLFPFEVGQSIEGREALGDYSGKTAKRNCIGDALDKDESVQPDDWTQEALDKTMGKAGCRKVQGDQECKKKEKKVFVYMLKTNKDTATSIYPEGAILFESLHVIHQECGKDTFRHVLGDGTTEKGPAAIFDNVKDPDAAAKVYLQRNDWKDLDLEKVVYCCPCGTQSSGE
jgi:hypothetical protein